MLTYDGGVFKFPLASYTRISDDYGNRIHPTLGIEQFHNGVDFAAPKGTAIYAAYDGQVVAATYSNTMGELRHDRPWRRPVYDLYACIGTVCVQG